MLFLRLGVCLVLRLQSKPWVHCGTSRHARAAVTHPNVPGLIHVGGIVYGTTTSSPVSTKECAHFRARKHAERPRPKPCCLSRELSTVGRSAESVGTVEPLCVRALQRGYRHCMRALSVFHERLPTKDDMPGGTADGDALRVDP